MKKKQIKGANECFYSKLNINNTYQVKTESRI